MDFVCEPNQALKVAEYWTEIQQVGRKTTGGMRWRTMSRSQSCIWYLIVVGALLPLS